MIEKLDEKNEKLDEKKIWRNLIIVLTITLVLAFILGKYWQDGNTFFDESMVAAGAFILLIYATFLQLIELSYQRRDLKLTRAEMRAHTKEVEQANNLSIQGMKQAQFFELLLLKENYYNDLSIEHETFALNFYKELHRILIREFMDNISEISKRQFVEDYKFIFDENYDYYKNITMEEKVKGIVEKNAAHDYIREYYSNDEAIIDDMFAGALRESYHIHVGSNFERLNIKILKLYLIHKNILELLNRKDNQPMEYFKTLYNAQIDKAERDLYNILEQEIYIDKFYDELLFNNFMGAEVYK